MRTGFGVILLFLATAACCDRGSRAALAGRSLPNWQLDLQTRIGSVEDPDVGLTRVTQVVFGPDDLVYVAQNAEREIRVYDLHGSLVHRIGRDGEGPGEFRNISAIGFLQDTLFVSDEGLRRYNMFTADGGFIDTFQWLSMADGTPKPPVFFTPTAPQVVLEGGMGLLQQHFGYFPGNVGEILIPWLRIDRTGTRQDTIAIQRLDFSSSEALTAGGRDFPIFPPITGAPLYQLMADGSGLAIIERPIARDAKQHVFRLVKISPEGDTILTREYTYSPLPVSAVEIDRQIALFMDGVAQMRAAPSREDVTELFHQPGFLPAYLPAVNTLRTGQDGSIWVQREVAERDSVAWNLVDGSGDMAGEIWLPIGTRIMAADGNLLAVLEQDEFDVPYVLIYRIDRRP